MRRPIVFLPLLLALAACAGPAATDGPLSQPQAARLLKSQGYADLHDLRAIANQGWEADATLDGKPVDVIVDAYGIIHLR